MSWKLKGLVYFYILSFEIEYGTSHTIKGDTKGKLGWSNCSQLYTQTYKKHLVYAKSQKLFICILLWPTEPPRLEVDPPRVMGGASALCLVGHFVELVGGIYASPTLPQWSSPTSFTPIWPATLLCPPLMLPTIFSKAWWSFEVIGS
jgi:hypothetical protein